MTTVSYTPRRRYGHETINYRLQRGCYIIRVFKERFDMQTKPHHLTGEAESKNPSHIAATYSLIADEKKRLADDYGGGVAV